MGDGSGQQPRIHHADATVFVDPFEKAPQQLFVWGPGNRSYVAPQTALPALAHEVSHALDDIRGTTSVPGNGNVSYSDRMVPLPGGGRLVESVPKFEHDAIDFENRVRAEAGLGKRLGYVNYDPVRGPYMLEMCRGMTCHQKVSGR